jgi:elongation factor Ts
MAGPSAADVKALREQTGAPMMDCKEALVESGGDVDEAVKILRKKGAASAAKRSGRGTGEGIVATYVHNPPTKGTMIELQCETDFVARNEEFQEFAREVAIHITAMNPSHVSAEDIPSDEREREREILAEKARQEGKPDDVV